MAKTTTAKAPKKVKKAAKPAKAVAKAAPKKKKSGGKAKGAADALWKMAEHPMVAELLAIGATAAVAAIAEGAGKGKKKTVSSRAVKQAGKAAAAAIGARLISEFADGAVKKATKSAKS